MANCGIPEGLDKKLSGILFAQIVEILIKKTTKNLGCLNKFF